MLLLFFIVEDCAFGDSEVWCSRIGTLYETSSCYKNENTCCKTCNKLRKKELPGKSLEIQMLVIK